MFAYELPLKATSSGLTGVSKAVLVGGRVSESIVVYNFHNLTLHDRLYFFVIQKAKNLVGSTLTSISELFPNSSWLEREIAELNGVGFMNKKDTRNLMLQYGDTTVPFQKLTPSIGYKELFFDSLGDVVIEVPTSIAG